MILPEAGGSPGRGVISDPFGWERLVLRLNFVGGELDDKLVKRIFGFVDVPAPLAIASPAVNPRFACTVGHIRLAFAVRANFPGILAGISFPLEAAKGHEVRLRDVGKGLQFIRKLMEMEAVEQLLTSVGAVVLCEEVERVDGSLDGHDGLLLVGNAWFGRLV
jgi:hypothetical protein